MPERRNSKAQSFGSIITTPHNFPLLLDSKEDVE